MTTATDRVTTYARKAGDMIGWDVFLPAAETPKVDETLAAVRAYIKGPEPEPDHRGGTMMEADKAHQAGRSIIEHEYYRLKWFKNGNAHIEFKRADLVATMNAILAKHYPGALPPRI